MSGLCRGGWAAPARWEHRKDALGGDKTVAAGTTQPGRAGWVTLALCKPPSEVSSVGRSWNEGRWAGQGSLVVWPRLKVSSSEAPSHQQGLWWWHLKGNGLSPGASLQRRLLR